MRDIEIHTFSVPMRLSYRDVSQRSGVLLRGPSGWGEFSPFPDYGAEASAPWLAAALEAASSSWPAPTCSSVEVNVPVPPLGPEAAYDHVVASRCRTAKVKVGEGDDVSRVEAVRDALGPEGHIRIDAKGAWDVDTAVRMLRQLERYDLEYAEQPVLTIADMAKVRRRVNVPLAADEIIRMAEKPHAIEGLKDAADVAVLKVQPMGGVRRGLEVAEALGMPVTIASAVETSVGLAGGLALAAALPDEGRAHGLATGLLLAGDVVEKPLVPEEGRLALRRPSVSRRLLQHWRAPEPLRSELLRRLRAASEAGAIDLGWGPGGLVGEAR